MQTPDLYNGIQLKRSPLEPFKGAIRIRAPKERLFFGGHSLHE